MKRFVKFLNRKLTINLSFKKNNTHVYNGPCLQIADNHGICFIFPIIIWFHYENTYKRSKTMLKKGNLTKFIVAQKPKKIYRKKIGRFVRFVRFARFVRFGRFGNVL